VLTKGKSYQQVSKGKLHDSQWGQILGKARNNVIICPWAGDKIWMINHANKIFSSQAFIHLWCIMALQTKVCHHIDLIDFSGYVTVSVKKEECILIFTIPCV
jgi:hypothetical protein